MDRRFPSLPRIHAVVRRDWVALLVEFDIERREGEDPTPWLQDPVAWLQDPTAWLQDPTAWLHVARPLPSQPSGWTHGRVRSVFNSQTTSLRETGPMAWMRLRSRLSTERLTRSPCGYESRLKRRDVEAQRAGSSRPNSELWTLWPAA